MVNKTPDHFPVICEVQMSASFSPYTEKRRAAPYYRKGIKEAEIEAIWLGATSV